MALSLNDNFHFRQQVDPVTRRTEVYYSTARNVWRNIKSNKKMFEYYYKHVANI